MLCTKSELTPSGNLLTHSYSFTLGAPPLLYSCSKPLVGDYKDAVYYSQGIYCGESYKQFTNSCRLMSITVGALNLQHPILHQNW